MLRVGVPLPASQTGQTVGVRQLASLLSDESLLRMTRDGRHEARLAERWEVDDGGRQLVVHLRPDLRFQDGSPLTPAAVKQTFEAVRGEPWQPYQYPTLDDIESIEVRDPRTLVFRLKRASALLLDDLELPIRKQDQARRAVGAGPFILETETADTTVMRANPHYYAGRPVIDIVELRTYSSVRSAWTAMMRGEVDFLYEVPTEGRAFVEGESNVRVFSFPRPYAFMLVFNLRHPQLRDPAVRRALNLAVDRRWVIDRGLGGHGLPASGHVWPFHWAYDRSAPTFGYAPTRAETILGHAEQRRPAAFPARLGNDMPARLRFTCLVPARAQPYEWLALFVQKQLYEAGVDMNLEVVPLKDFIRRTDSGNFESVIVDFNGGPGLVRPYQFWRSSARPLFSGFGYTAADQALDAIRYAPDEASFRRAVSALQRVFAEDPPALFLAWSETARAVSRRFEVPVADDQDPLRVIWAWRPAESARPSQRSADVPLQ